MSRVYYYSKTDVGLTEAVGAFKGKLEGAVALLYSPTDCIVAQVKNGGFTGAKGEVDIATVFEARVFSNECELRWLKGRPNRAALLAESELDTDWERHEKEVEAADDKHCYILWGLGTGEESNGWGSVSSARVGTIPLPLKVPQGRYVALKAVEYIADDFEDGNCAVFDERLIGLEVRDASQV